MDKLGTKATLGFSGLQEHPDAVTTYSRCPHQPPAPTPVAGAGPGPWNPGAGVYSVYLGVSFSACSFVMNDYF